MAEILEGQPRTDFGKGAARQLRRDGRIPAVLYGNGDAPIHLHLDGHTLTQQLRHKATSLEVSYQGKTYSVTPRDIQLEPVRRYIEHVDLIVVTAAQAAAIAQAAAAATARADAEAQAAANAAAEKAAARAARQAGAAAGEAATDEAPAADAE